MRRTTATAAVGIALAGIALATYSNSFESGFVLDSQVIILASARVHAATADNLHQIFAVDYWYPGLRSLNYRPLTTLSYLLNYAVLGNADRPAGYHWINLGLHWLNTVLVFLLAARLTGAVAWAFWTAALFATHPVATEAVTNIVGRADLLACASVLGGLLLYLRARSAAGWRRLAWLTALSLTTAVGLFCKEPALVVVGLVVFVDLIWPDEVTSLLGPAVGSGRPSTPPRRPAKPDTARRRVDSRATAGDSPPKARSAILKPRLFAAAPRWIALAPPLLLFWIVRSRVFAEAGPAPSYFAENHMLAADFWSARLTACKCIARYVWLLLWPARLCCDYSVNAVPLFQWTWRGDDWQAAAGVLAILGLLVVAVVTRRRSPGVCFYLGVIAASLAPVSNLIVLIPSVIAERFLYLPVVGFAGLVGLSSQAVARMLDRQGAESRGLKWGSIGVHVALAALVAAYAIRSHRRNADWRNDLTLWSSAVATCPDSFRAHKGLAMALYNADPAGNLDRAIAEAELAEGIVEAAAPPSVSVGGAVRDALGVYYRAKGDALAKSSASAAESAGWYRKAVDTLQREIDWTEEANREYRRHEREQGRNADKIWALGMGLLHLNLGLAHLRLDQPEEALAAFVRATIWAPGSAELQLAASAAQARLGRNEDAIRSLFQVLVLDRSRPEVWPQLFELYQRVDPGGCAFRLVEGQPRFNDKCPIARRHMCEAYEMLEGSLRAAGQTGAADQARAARERGCTTLGGRR